MSKNILGKHIKAIRKAKKLTQKDMAKLTGYSQNSISNHENGHRKIDETDIMIYAEALGVEPQELFSTDNIADKVTVKQIPVVSEISAGLPIYSEQNILEYSYVPSSMFKGGKELFGLKVTGDSMDKEFREGDVVIVEKNAIVENGQIGVVMVNGYKATVKRIRYNDDKIILLPESTNPEHLPQVYGDKDEVNIIGKVISSQKFY